MKRLLQTPPPDLHAPERPRELADEAIQIPAVCFLEDVCRILRVARRTAEKLRRHRAFPIPELPSLDRRPRFAGADVRAFLERRHTQTVTQTRRRVAS